MPASWCRIMDTVAWARVKPIGVESWCGDVAWHSSDVVDWHLYLMSTFAVDLGGGAAEERVLGHCG